MITFTLEFWQIGAAAYFFVAVFLMIVANGQVALNGENTNWWRLTAAFVWPLLIPVVLALTIGENARSVRQRLRNKGIYRDFCEWHDAQKKAGKI